MALADEHLDDLRGVLDAFVRRCSFTPRVLSWLPPATERTSVPATFAAELSGADAVRPIQQIVDRVAATDGLLDRAQADDVADFALGRDQLSIRALLEAQDLNTDCLPRLLADLQVKQQATDLVVRAAYECLRAPAAPGATA